jgi:hypothetical protein
MENVGIFYDHFENAFGIFYSRLHSLSSFGIFLVQWDQAKSGNPDVGTYLCGKPHKSIPPESD